MTFMSAILEAFGPKWALLINGAPIFYGNAKVFTRGNVLDQDSLFSRKLHSLLACSFPLHVASAAISQVKNTGLSTVFMWVTSSSWSSQILFQVRLHMLKLNPLKKKMILKIVDNNLNVVLNLKGTPSSQWAFPLSADRSTLIKELSFFIFWGWFSFSLAPSHSEIEGQATTQISSWLLSYAWWKFCRWIYAILGKSFRASRCKKTDQNMSDVLLTGNDVGIAIFWLVLRTWTNIKWHFGWQSCDHLSKARGKRMSVVYF